MRLTWLLQSFERSPDWSAQKQACASRLCFLGFNSFGFFFYQSSCFLSFVIQSVVLSSLSYINFCTDFRLYTLEIDRLESCYVVLVFLGFSLYTRFMSVTCIFHCIFVFLSYFYQILYPSTFSFLGIPFYEVPVLLEFVSPNSAFLTDFKLISGNFEFI